MAFYKRRFRKYKARSKPKRTYKPLRNLAFMKAKKLAFGKTGGFVLKRHVDLTTIYNNNSIAAGTIAIQQGAAAASTWLFTGTPVLAAGAVAGNPSTALYDIPFAMNFKLGDITSYTDVTSLADKYKLGLISIKLLLNGQSPSYQAGAPAPFIEYVYDHDDSNVPTVAALTQKMGLRTKNFGLSGKCNIHVRPVPTMVVGEAGSTAVAMVPKSSTWINATDYNVNHYGIKGVIRNFACSSTVNVMSAISFDAVMTIIAKDLQ